MPTSSARCDVFRSEPQPTIRASGPAPLALGALLALLAAAPAAAQVCEPLDAGPLAQVVYQDTAIFWEPVVELERMVLTIAGPCEDIVKVFRSGEQISFDLSEIQRVEDGAYTWQLRREPAIDPATSDALAKARESGDDSIWWSLFEKGAIPAGPYVDSASFTVHRGLIIDPSEGRESGAAPRARLTDAGSSVAGTADGVPSIVARDQVIADDLIVQGRACVGPDCVNGESFGGLDTLRLKDINTRIQFFDTSTGSFASNNWQIRANSAAKGGANFLGFVDQGPTGVGAWGTLTFAVEAGAGANALYVKKRGNVGFGTDAPVLDLHVVSGNTPALRLEQTKAVGFAPQTWDIAGNEAGFFVRDVTGGERLPFRIKPQAPHNSIVIEANGNVGMGTIVAAGAPLHVQRTDGTAVLRVEEASGVEAVRELVELTNNGTVTIRFTDTQGTFASGDDFDWIAGLTTNDSFVITPLGSSSSPLWEMDAAGNVSATSFNATSSRAAKQAFAPVDAVQLLARLAELPIAEWQYKGDATGARHIGPTAEDFRAAFGLDGPHQGHLSLSDLSGVALVAIQGLHRALEAKEAALGRLAAENQYLAGRLEALETVVSSLLATGR